MKRRGNFGSPRPKYNETKTTQAAALLLKLHDGEMAYMKLVKLLYNIDREALKRWGRQITYDEIYSLPHGMILSITLDKAETSDPVVPTYWDEFIRTRGYNAQLVNDCSDGELSDAEVALIEEFSKVYWDKDAFDMEKEHHNPELFPEWENPGQSRIPTSIQKILLDIGYGEEESQQIHEDIIHEAGLLEFINS